MIKAMQALTNQPKIQERVLVHRHRTVEELYDLKNDPEEIRKSACTSGGPSSLPQYVL